MNSVSQKTQAGMPVLLKSHLFARREDSARWPVSGAAQEWRRSLPNPARGPGQRFLPFDFPSFRRRSAVTSGTTSLGTRPFPGHRWPQQPYPCAVGCVANWLSSRPERRSHGSPGSVGNAGSGRLSPAVQTPPLPPLRATHFGQPTGSASRKDSRWRIPRPLRPVCVLCRGTT